MWFFVMKCWNYIFRRNVNGERGMSIIKCCKQFSCILHLHLASRVFLFSVFCFLSSVLLSLALKFKLRGVLALN